MDFTMLQNYLEKQKQMQLAQNGGVAPAPGAPSIDPDKYQQFLGGFQGNPQVADDDKKKKF